MREMQKLAYSIPDLIDLSGLGRSFIYAEIKAGRLKIRKAGRRSIVLPEDADNWLRQLPELWKRKVGR